MKERKKEKERKKKRNRERKLKYQCPLCLNKTKRDIGTSFFSLPKHSD